MRRIKFTWESEAGKETTKRLDAWGAREREIKATGSAITVGGTEGAGGRGRTGDYPSMLLAALDVDRILTDWKTPAMLLALLRFVYRDGRQEEVTSIEYTLSDGTVVELGPHEIAPPQAVACDVRTKVNQRIEWDAFCSAELDQALHAYYPRHGFRHYRRRHLQRVLTDFAADLAEECGLGQFREPDRKEA